MTISVDAASVNTGHSLGRSRRRDLDTESCGNGVEWSRGLKGLPRPPERPPEVSGSLLTKVIEREIIPRLFLAHRNLQQIEEPGKAQEIQPEVGDSDVFARLVLSSEPAEILDRVEALMMRGVTLERIFLDLLAPVARKLGEFWDKDLCTFTDVTLGLSRLHQILHEIGRRKFNDVADVAAPRRAYLVPTPGEQHTFGLSMLEEFFLHAGWETASDYTASERTILETVAAQNLEVVGFSVGCKEFLDPLSELIEKARNASRNRDVTIMLGGRTFLEFPELASKFAGATVVTDGVHAVQIAEALVSRVRSGGVGKLM
jgi:methanogenic corrinoid protein MtbC1